jgi:glycosyltransferase involved in cell wall biosynthesis
VQRYAHEIVSRLSCATEVLVPKTGVGLAGHAWEQAMLPVASRGRLLWSPCGSGPAYYRDQVVTVHDLFAIDHPEWYSPLYARWHRFLLTRLVKNAVYLIAVSEYTKSRLVRVLGCDPNRIATIYNGLTSGCERAAESQVREALAALGVPTRRYILTLASLEPRKNLRTVLEAWSAVHSELPPDVWLVVAGQQAPAHVYAQQELKLSSPRILLTGYVPERHLAGLYTGASLFLFPSLAEGFGLPLLEAMACGTRAVTSNTSSLPEVGGDVVSYVDPLDVRGLGKMIRRHLTDAAQDSLPFTPAMERARRFDWRSSSAQTQCVLEQAANSIADPARIRGVLRRPPALGYLEGRGHIIATDSAIGPTIAD